MKNTSIPLLPGEEVERECLSHTTGYRALGPGPTAYLWFHEPSEPRHSSKHHAICAVPTGNQNKLKEVRQDSKPQTQQGFILQHPTSLWFGFLGFLYIFVCACICVPGLDMKGTKSLHLIHPYVWAFLFVCLLCLCEGGRRLWKEVVHGKGRRAGIQSAC